MLLVDATWPYSRDGMTDIGWQCCPHHGSTNRQPPPSPARSRPPFLTDPWQIRSPAGTAIIILGPPRHSTSYF